MKALLIVLAVAIMVAAAALLPVRPYLDFQVIFHADLGLLRGIGLYDHAGQAAMVADLAHVNPDQVFVLPFPYPPWYALSTLWLALLPIDVASRAWFGLSLFMLVISVWLMAQETSGPRRIAAFVVALFWLPVLGSLFVGQYGFPVLLGATMMIYALRRERPELTALAAVLLTFKPHLGAGILILVVAYLWSRRGAFGRHALIAILLAAALLFAVGFLASPIWPLDYLHSLSGFRDVSQCHQCVSPSMAAVGLFGGGLDQAIWVSAVIGVVLLLVIVMQWSWLSSTPQNIVVGGVLATLLISPYLQNYDYLLLLVPLLMLVRSARGWAWFWIALAFLLPLVSLGLFGTAGNVALVGSAFVVTAVAGFRLFRQGRSPATL
jgi:hypothetical protein